MKRRKLADLLVEAAISDLDLVRKHGARRLRFRDLPEPARRALSTYFSAFGDWSDSPRENDAIVGDELWWIGELPTEVAKAEVFRRLDRDFLESKELGDFEAYHRWYLAKEDTPRHPARDRWPVLLSGQPEDEFVWDGWHRFHSYVRSGHATVPVVLADSVPGSKNARTGRAQRIPVVAGGLYLSRTRNRGFRADTDHVQDVVEGVKRGDRQAARQAAGWLVKALRDLRGGYVVPAPRSTPDRPSMRTLGEALVAAGVDATVVDLVRRATPVPSSRILRRKGMHGVSPQIHRASIEVRPPAPGEERTPLLVVDDVLTRGNVLTACVQALRAAGWVGPIRAAVVAQVATEDGMKGRPAIRPRIASLHVVHALPAVAAA